MTSSGAATAPDITAAYVGGRIFTADPNRPWVEAIAVAGDRIAAVGSDDDVRTIAGSTAAQVHDLRGALVIPGFIDAHFHTFMSGDALRRVDLELAPDLPAIQSALAAHAAARPDDEWVFARGWLFDAVPDRAPTAAMLDAVVPDRPVLMDSADYHFVWLNSAALRELGIDESTADPVGGEVVRDANGVATGLLAETAAHAYAWAEMSRRTTDEVRRTFLVDLQAAAHASGITGVIDMGLDDVECELLARAADEGWLTLRVVGHYVIERHGDTADHLARVHRAAELSRKHDAGRFRVAGVKIVIDGTIDGCTAHVSQPYTTGDLPDPIWDLDSLTAVVTEADAAGLQVAMHAIGDSAVSSALTALERARRTNGTSGRRHRIEHIEYMNPDDIARFVDLGVTASMQPVHADPAIAQNWIAMLGEPRGSHGFRWADLVNADVRLAFGTDAPTAPYAPLPNMYIAATRRSALNPSLPAGRGVDQVRPLDEALVHATADAAWSCFEEDERGSLRPGLLADFVVVHPDVFDQPADALLTAKVAQTVVSGVTVYEGDAS
jgi:predicted amidohydrolase YtcJ